MVWVQMCRGCTWLPKLGGLGPLCLRRSVDLPSQLDLHRAGCKMPRTGLRACMNAAGSAFKVGS